MKPFHKTFLSIRGNVPSQCKSLTTKVWFSEEEQDRFAMIEVDPLTILYATCGIESLRQDVPAFIRRALNVPF